MRRIRLLLLYAQADTDENAIDENAIDENAIDENAIDELGETIVALGDALIGSDQTLALELVGFLAKTVGSVQQTYTTVKEQLSVNLSLVQELVEANTKLRDQLEDEKALADKCIQSAQAPLEVERLLDTIGTSASSEVS